MKTSAFFSHTKREKKYYSFLSIVFILIIVGVIFPTNSAQAALDEIASFMLGHFMYPLIYLIFWILFYVAYVIAWIGASLVSANLNPVLMNSVLTSSGIQQGWEIFLDISYLLFILILLLVAFGTIFQSDSYNIKKSLFKLFLVAVLINFSMMIAGAIIDFTNILMYGILKMMCAGNEQCFQDFTSMLLKSIEDLYNTYKLENSVQGYISWEGISVQSVVGMAIAMIYTFIYGLTLMALAIFLLIRIAAFALLLILSPLAFLGEIIPSLKSISSKWWDNLWQYAFFGPIFALLLYVTGLMASTTFTVGSSSISQNSDLGAFTSLFATIITNIIPLIFLMAIIPITRSMGIAMSGAVMGTVVVGGAALAGSVADRWLARGAAMEGSKEKGFKGSLSRLNAGARRGLSNFSIGSWKRANKAYNASLEHDYDVATGAQRNKLETIYDPVGAAKNKYTTMTGGKSIRPDYKQMAIERKAHENWKEKDVKNANDAIELTEKGKKGGTMTEEEMKISVKFIAAEGGIDDLLDRSTDSTGVIYGKGAEGLVRYVDETFKGLSDEEKSKLLANISMSEIKNGNTAYEGLSVSGYNARTRKMEYIVNRIRVGVNYIDPSTGTIVSETGGQIDAQVKSANKKDPKDLKKSSFLDKTGAITEAGERILSEMKGKRADRIGMMDRDRAVAIDTALTARNAIRPIAVGSDLGNAWRQLKIKHGL